MKKIYEFSVSKDNFVEKPVIRKDESGVEIKVLEKINEPIISKYFLAKPSFSIKQESNLYYESVIGECYRRGILSSIQLRKRFINDDGILSDEEKKSNESLWTKLWEIKAEILKLNEDQEVNKEKLKEANDQIVDILTSLQTIEEKSGGNLLYEHTAEKLANDRTVIWLFLNLSYKETGNGKYEPLFGKGAFEDKLKKYEEIELNDGDDLDLYQKLILIASLWYFNKAETQDDFDNLIKVAENQNLLKK